jgi:hypothetical protein
MTRQVTLVVVQGVGHMPTCDRPRWQPVHRDVPTPDPESVSTLQAGWGEWQLDKALLVSSGHDILTLALALPAGLR